MTAHDGKEYVSRFRDGHIPRLDFLYCEMSDLFALL